MTNEQLKQHAIQEAYVEHWGEVKDFVNASGWINAKQWLGEPGNSVIGSKIKNLECLDNYHAQRCYMFRPKSLAGIDNNNGWVRISGDGSNLPLSKTTLYKAGILTEDKQWCEYKENSKMHEILEIALMSLITHYRPVVEHPKPVY